MMNINNKAQQKCSVRNENWLQLLSSSFILLLIIMICSTQIARAAIIDFDDLSVGTGQFGVLGTQTSGNWTEYRGYNWLNMGIVDENRPGYGIGVESSPVAMINNSSWPRSWITSDRDFNFSGLYLTSIYSAKNYSPYEMVSNNEYDVLVTGYKDGSEIYAKTFYLTQISQYLALNFSQIDSVRFEAQIDTNQELYKFAGDNLEMTFVSIPPALWLFGSGLISLLGIPRRSSGQA